MRKTAFRYLENCSNEYEAKKEFFAKKKKKLFILLLFKIQNLLEGEIEDPCFKKQKRIFENIKILLVKIRRR